MCEEMKEGNWTIERDEDLTAPYAFMNKTWMSFDDSVSVSIKVCIIIFNFKNINYLKLKYLSIF